MMQIKRFKRKKELGQPQLITTFPIFYGPLKEIIGGVAVTVELHNLVK